ncbi:MAG: hypothetical protein NT150_09450, partial [Bacteroidetes bacterium]|nr:hypothetical protein [Bacteroidota bacterium]
MRVLFLQNLLFKLKSTYLFLVGIVLFCFVSNGFAQRGTESPIHFKFFGSKEGIKSDRRIKLVQQDQFGLLWIGCTDGLMKFDGQEFIECKNIDAKINQLLHSNINDLFNDSHGNLWVATQLGTVVYLQVEGKFKLVDFPINAVYTINITEQANGTIWLATMEGIFSVDKNFKANIFFDNAKFHNTIPSVHVNKMNHLFVVTHNKLYEYNDNNLLNTIQFTNDLKAEDNLPTASAFDQMGNLWMGKINGLLYRYSPGEKKVQCFDFKKIGANPSAIVDRIFSNKKDRTWFAINESGIWYFDYEKSEFQSYISPEKTGKKLPSYKLTAFLIDKENNYWFGANNAGLVMTNDNLNLIHALPLAPEYQNTIVSAVCVDYQKRVWVGTDGGGVLLFDEQMRLLQQYNYRDNDPS